MLALLLVVGSVPSLPQPATTSFLRPASIQSTSFEERLAEAGDDTDKLWSLYLWCDTAGKTREGKSVLRKITELDPAHRDANLALGNIEYEGRWFANKRKLDAFKKEQEEREARERGLVSFRGEWVPKNDLPFLERGLVRGPDGGWVTHKELALFDQGWVRQDLEWVPPDEVENIAKGLWKCGDQWLELAEANRYHARIGQWWKLSSHYFTVYTTLDREVALEAATVLDRTFDDLVRVFGRAPEDPPMVILLREEQQYVDFAESGRGGQPTDGSRVYAVYRAYLADEGIDVESGEFLGASVGVWNNETDAGRRLGRLATRHAAGQAFAQAIDPSPKAVAKAEKKPERGMNLDAFYQEKQFPTWYRYAAATYVERYFVDSLVAADGNPHWPKAWSVENLNIRGGLIPLSMFFGRNLDVTDEASAGRWINQCGLLMAFILDGGFDDVVMAHRELVEAVASGAKTKSIQKLVLELQAKLTEHEVDIRTFMTQP